jgi:hypothetical protein
VASAPSTRMTFHLTIARSGRRAPPVMVGSPAMGADAPDTAAGVGVVVSHLQDVDRVARGLIEGLYRTGPIALGDYRPGLSDADFLGVTSQPLGSGAAAVASVHWRMPAPPHYDGIYLERTVLAATPDDSPAALHPGDRRRGVEDEGWAVRRAAVQGVGGPGRAGDLPPGRRASGVRDRRPHSPPQRWWRRSSRTRGDAGVGARTGRKGGRTAITVSRETTLRLVRRYPG